MPFVTDTTIRYGDLVYLTCQRTTPTKSTDTHGGKTDQGQAPSPNSVTAGFRPRDTCRVIKEGNQNGREVMVIDDKDDHIKVRSDEGRIRTYKREDLELVGSGEKPACDDGFGSRGGDVRDLVGVLTAEPRTAENMTTEGHSVAKIR